MSDVTGDFELHALTHLDGRNAHKLSELRNIFSEFQWIGKRLDVMVRFMLFLYPKISKKRLSPKAIKKLQAHVAHISAKEIKEIKKIEKVVNHDIKAIEVFLVALLKRDHLDDLARYVNLGIGSEDINNVALALSVGEMKKVLVHHLSIAVRELNKLSTHESKTTMVGRTHAQPANLTSFGKEIANTLIRLCDEFEVYSTIAVPVKFSGEVGTYQAYGAVDPMRDWIAETDSFIRTLGLTPFHGATQIAPYDGLARLFQSFSRINTILIDLVHNLWLYVLLGYVRVVPEGGEVGSAGMPHKVNPIYLEVAEGNLKMANIVFEGLCRELPVNRLQRSFADSTMRRNVVLPFAFSFLAYQSITEGVKRIRVDKQAIKEDIDAHPEVWTESVKAYGLTHGISDMYERLRKETRGKVLTPGGFSRLIGELPLTDTQKAEITYFCQEYTNPYPAIIVAESVKRAKKLFGI